MMEPVRANAPEYYIRRKSVIRFEVAKFDWSDSPVAVYVTEYSQAYDSGKCECRGYTAWHVECRHIRMVREWVAGGERVPSIFQPTRRNKPWPKKRSK